MKNEINNQWLWGDIEKTDISPSWVGGDGIFTKGVDKFGNAVLRRKFTKESRPYASGFGSVSNMMTVMGDLGIAPKVLQIDEDSIVMRRMPDTWQNAKLDDLRNPYILWPVLEQYRKVHLVPLASIGDVQKRNLIDDVYTMLDLYKKTGEKVPSDIDKILSDLDPFLSKVDHFHENPLPCHGDGAASNILIDRSIKNEEFSRPLLTGWTISGIMDPLEEAGSILSEVGPFCGVPSALITGLGLPDGSLPVAQTFGILSDLFWALIGLWRSAITETPEIDFIKYGLWRLVKARNQLFLPIGPASWLKSL